MWVDRAALRIWLQHRVIWLQNQVTFWSRRFGNALLRVLYAAVFTFGPFILLSIHWTEREHGLNAIGFWGSFAQFWTHGEMLLPILGVSSAVAATLLLNPSMLPRIAVALLHLLIVCVAFASAFAISESKGFRLPMADWLVLASYYFYAGMALIWTLVIALEGTIEPHLRDSQAAADKILKEVKEMRGNGENG